jgi:hypothetical protein
MKGLTRRKEKMIHPTKIHLAISNRTGTAQSSPHFLAIVVVHCLSATIRDDDPGLGIMGIKENGLKIEM